MSKSFHILKNEFKNYCSQFNYVPTEFPEEVSFENSVCKKLSLKEKEKLISNIDEINSSFDITGYMWALDLIKATKKVNIDISNHVFCAEFPIDSFNARVIASKDTYGFLIFLNRGTRNLIWNFSLAYSYHLLNKTKNIIKDPFEVMLLYYRDKAPYQPIKYQFEYPPEKVLKVAGNVSASLRLFIVAHEISHIELGHTNNPIKSIKDEYEADKLAIEIILEISRKTGMYIFFCGGFINLVMLVILDVFQETVFNYSSNKSADHPDNFSRLEEIGKQLDSICTNNESKFSIEFYITMMPLIDFITGAKIEEIMGKIIIENNNKSIVIG